MGIHLGTRHHDLGVRFKPLAAFLLAVAVGCGPWFVKNAVLTGNPTYPLLFEWFGGTSRTDELDRHGDRRIDHSRIPAARTKTRLVDARLVIMSATS